MTFSRMQPTMDAAPGASISWPKVTLRDQERVDTEGQWPSEGEHNSGDSAAKSSVGVTAPGGNQKRPPQRRAKMGKRSLVNLSALAALLVASLIAWQYSQQRAAMQNYDRLEKHTYVVIQQLDALLSHVTEAETGQRGFLLAETEAYLDPYKRAILLVETDLGTLRALTRDNELQQQRLDKIEPLVREKMAEMKRAVDLGQSHEFKKARQVFDADNGRAEMEKIRVEIAQARGEEELLLASRRAAKDAALEGMFWRVTLGGAGCFAVLISGLVVLRDEISRRELNERSLRENEERLRLATEAVGMFSWECDLISQKVRWSANTASIIGCMPQELGNDIACGTFFVNKEDADRVNRQFQVCLAENKESFAWDFRGREESGGCKFWTAQGRILRDEDGVPVRVVGVTQDVTSKKRAEEELRESERRLQLALEGGRMGLWEWDLSTNRSVWNEREFELLGLNPAGNAAGGESFFRRLHPEDADKMQRSLEHAAKNGGEWVGEFRVVLGTGEIRWLAGAGRVFRDGPEPKERFVGVHYDITDRKNFQQELERLVAERTAKLRETVAELEHFSFTVTHDMKAPLRAMRAFAEAAAELCITGPAEQQKVFLERIMQAGERMDALIKDALNFSQAMRQEMPLEPVNIGRLLRGMLDTYPEFQSANADIQVADNLPMVLANEAGLTQCFSNLLGNAVKFVLSGAKAQVRVRSEPLDAKVRIWIEDNGIGIPSTVLPHIFEMFSRGSADYPGSGIGLALVRKVVHRMGGRVGVESEVGKGSRFWLELTPVELGKTE